MNNPRRASFNVECSWGGFLPSKLSLKSNVNASLDDDDDQSVSSVCSSASTASAKLRKSLVKQVKKAVGSAGYRRRSRVQCSPDNSKINLQADTTESTCSATDHSSLSGHFNATAQTTPDEPPVSPLGHSSMGRSTRRSSRRYSSETMHSSSKSSSSRHSNSGRRSSRRVDSRDGESKARRPRRTKSNDEGPPVTRSNNGGRSSRRRSSSIRRSNSSAGTADKRRAPRRSLSLGVGQRLDTSRRRSQRQRTPSPPPAPANWECNSCHCCENEARFRFCVGCGISKQEALGQS